MCVCGERMIHSNGRTGPYWNCLKCKLTHGAHKFDGRFEGHRSHERGEPLGIPCDADTTELRHKAHAALDKLWSTAMDRSYVYRRLAATMRLPADGCHIARFGKTRCEEALEHLKEPGEWM